MCLCSAAHICTHPELLCPALSSLCIRITLGPTLNISRDKSQPCPAVREGDHYPLPSRDNRHTVRAALDCATSIRKRVALETCTDLCNLNTDHRREVSYQPCRVSSQLSAEFAHLPPCPPSDPSNHTFHHRTETDIRPALPVRSGSASRECCWS